MPFFSIVIPLYNKEKYLEATLLSVLSQTFEDYEVIIVDDASTDSSAAVAGRFESEKIRIVRHEKNRGLSAARNTGISLSDAENIAFIDADDTWKPFFLEKMAEMIRRFPFAGLYASGYEECYPGGISVGIHKNLDFREDEMNIVTDFFTASSHQPLFCYSCVVVKKDVFSEAGYFDEKITLGEDVDFNIRANLKYKLAYYNRSCADYTIFSENQITASGIGGKTVTDFGRYEKHTTEHPSLRTYLDINRYILAISYKLAGQIKKSSEMAHAIDLKNLTPIQRMLLVAPSWVIKMLRTVKNGLVKKGIRLTTFNR